MNLAALATAIVLFVVGFIGTVLPMLPGPILVYGGMVLYGFMTDFQTLDPFFFLVQGLVLLLIFASDYVSSAAGAKFFGGSSKSSLGAVAGTLVAILFLGPLGIIIGPLVGASVVHFIQTGDLKGALRAGFGTFLGTLGGTVFKLFSEILMVIYFFITILL